MIEVLWCEKNKGAIYTIYTSLVFCCHVYMQRLLQCIEIYRKMHQLTCPKIIQIILKFIKQQKELKQCVINAVAFVYVEQPSHHKGHFLKPARTGGFFFSFEWWCFLVSIEIFCNILIFVFAQNIRKDSENDILGNKRMVLEKGQIIYMLPILRLKEISLW